jgi:hypothetical protein
MESRKDDLNFPSTAPVERNRGALVIGRLRNLEGWKKRNDKLLEKRGSEITLKAAIARWGKNQKQVFWGTKFQAINSSNVHT